MAAILPFCEMNVTHLHEQLVGSEFAVDPILLREKSSGDADKGFVGHLVGNLCMETDVLTWRPVRFGRTPERDDIIVFVNSAGYQMDFVEARTHSIPVPQKIALFRKMGSWRWCRESEFSALDMHDSHA